MKRYKPKMFWENPVTKEINTFEDYRTKQIYLGEYHIRVTMVEDINGEWVKYKDVKTPLTAQEIEILDDIIDMYRQEFGTDDYRSIEARKIIEKLRGKI